MRTRQIAGGTALSVLLATASLLGVAATPAAATDGGTAVPPVSSFSQEDPALAATTLTVNAPATALPGDEVTVTGTLASSVPFADGTTVTVTRTDSATADAPLGTATVAADGTFSLKDTPSALGTSTYTVSYAGDTDHDAATGSATVSVARTATALTVNAPATALPGDEVTVTGTLASSVPFADGTTVTVTRTDSVTADAPLGTATVAADGTFSLKDTPSALGTSTYTVSYAGDTDHDAATGSATVSVARTATALTVNAPATGIPGREVVVTGTFSSPVPFPAGTRLTVTRTDSAHPAGVTLGTIGVASNGTFLFRNVPSALGNNTYTVSYAGDAQHAAATAKDTVKVARVASTLTVSAPSSAKRSAKITVTGRLTSSVSFPAGTRVAVVRTDLTYPKGKSLGTKTVASNGTFSFTDTPTTGGSVTYTATYAGNAQHNPATGKDTVAVSRLATSVSIRTNHSTYSYGATATVIGHLGKTGKSRVVSIYAQPAGGTKKLVKTANVNSAGDLKVTYKLSRNTTFWASFGGDFSYAPKSVSRAVGTQVKVSTSVSRHYRTGKIGSTNYYWFRKNAAPLFSTTMTYATNREERFELEVYYQGRWYPADKEYFELGTAGKALVTLPGPGEAGIRARVRVSYIKGSSGDSLNTTTYGDWKYLYFTN
ncbi:Ig-like domain repeat protein [Streptomyces sp. NPDC002574]|uniref:Ig-like domain repeat protein n=1 Tax=Streptomyces sp. NPDC002574 TaxID=3364652 RepID=UPI0036B99EC6